MTADGEIRHGVVAGIKRDDDETTVVVAIELEPGEVTTYAFPEEKVRKAIADARADTSAP